LYKQRVIEISPAKKKKKKLQELFIENCTLVEEAFILMRDTVVAYLDEDFVLAEKKAAESIQVEKKQDRLREEIIRRLFSRETMVFSRSDRLSIIESLDKIVDKVEIFVQELICFKSSISEQLKADLMVIVDKSVEIGSEIKELVVSVLEDFSKGEEHITRITDLRREVRDLHWELLRKNYELKPDYLDFTYNENLIKNLCKVADRAEEFADQIYGFICKYAL